MTMEFTADDLRNLLKIMDRTQFTGIAEARAVAVLEAKIRGQLARLETPAEE